MKHLIILLIMLFALPCPAVDFWVDVDIALSEVQVNLIPLSTDGTDIDSDVNYNETGLVLIWCFETTANVVTHTAVTPTNTGGDYDWVEVGIGSGKFTIEIPASGGATINNDTEGFGYFIGNTTANLPWRGPIYGFRAAVKNNLEIYDATAQANQSDTYDGTGYVGGTIVSQADVTKWIGTAVATPTIAGVPEVDITFVDGSAVPAATSTLFSDGVSLSQLGDKVVADMDANSVDLNAILIDTTEIGSGVAMDSGTATIAGMLTKMADDNGGATFNAGNDSLNKIRTRGDAAWTSGSSDAVTTTVASAASARSITLTAGTPVVNAHRYMILTITDADGNTSIESRVITSWSAGRIANVDEPFSFTPTGGDVATIAQASYFKPIQVP